MTKFNGSAAQAVEQEALSIATEDWTAFWEIASLARRLVPDANADEIRVLVRDAIGRLVAKGYLYLCTFDFRVNECVPLDDDQVEAALRNASNWGPLEELQVRVGATDAGMDAYFGSREAWVKGKRGSAK